MAVRMTKDWVAAQNIIATLKGNMGVFEFALADHTVQFIGFAGGRSRYGLKGEVADALASQPDVAFVRVEVTTSYHTRYRELLMAHVADHGHLPPRNPDIKLGKLSPA